MICHARPIPSCPGYFVSDTGRVWGPRKEIKLYPNSRGYLTFCACLAGQQRTAKVQHVVAEAFLGRRVADAYVCHRNDQREDNRAANLYYGDAHTNNMDTYRNGRRPQGGADNGRAKLTPEQVRAIRQRYAAGDRVLAQLGRHYGVHPRTISDIVRHRSWKWQVLRTQRKG